MSSGMSLREAGGLAHADHAGRLPRYGLLQGGEREWGVGSGEICALVERLERGAKGSVISWGSCVGEEVM